MRQTAAKPTFLASVLTIIVLSLVVALNAVATWRQADSAWLYSDSDHENLAPMYYKLHDSTLFSQDYIFHDDRFFRFYTPSFLVLIGITGAISGDYFHGVALLQAPVLAAYLLSAYALFWQVTRSRAIALICTLFSIFGISVVIDFWRVNGLGSMLPRTVALPVVVLAAFLLIRYLTPGERHLNGQAGWHWLLLGALVGIAANLHPTTGITLALMAGVLMILASRRLNQPKLLHAAIFIAATFITATPIVLNVAGGSTTRDLTAADFDVFVRAFQARIAMPPYSGSRLADLTLEWLYLPGILWLLLTAASWYLAKNNRRSWATLLFALVQLAYAWFLIRNSMDSLDTLFILIPALFFVWRWWMCDEQQEMLFFEMIAAVIAISFLLPLGLRVIWLNLKIWGLTTLVAELPRGARLLTLPLYLIGARVAVQVARQSLRPSTVWLIFMAVLSILTPVTIWHGVLAALFIFERRRQSHPITGALWSGGITGASVYFVHNVVTQTDGTLLALIVGAATALAAFLLAGTAEPKRWGIILLGTGIVLVILTALNVISPINFANDSPWYSDVLRGAPDLVTFLLASVAGLGLWLLFRRDLFPPSLAAWSRRGEVILCLTLIGIMGIQAAGLFRYSLRPDDSEKIPPLIQAALWARAHSDQDALFLIADGNGSAFRLWSQRSITHGKKELGLVAYSNPRDLAALQERFERLVQAAQSPDDLLAIADELDVDYLVVPQDFSLHLLSVYRNSEVQIYHIPR